MGRVSNKGVIPVAPWTFDQVGPVTRTAEDSALILDALVPGLKAIEALSDGLKGLRVGVVEALFASGIDTRVAATVRAATEELSTGGAELMSVELPLLRSAIAIQQVMMLPEAASAHLNLLRTRFGDLGADVRGRLLGGLLLPGAAYVSGMRGRALYQDMLRRTFESCDLLVAPTMPSIAPRMDHEMVKIDGKEVPYPVSFPAFCHPWSVAGVPVVTVPCGFVDKMPVGMSLVGRPSEDAMVLRAAHGFQAITNWHQKAPPL
jgi:aspartyl-tRNA(Asn)/glutamyl-tRNA(Gln) amidotransferase subunit A